MSATNVARGQTGKHLCRQHCVHNNVSSFARALTGPTAHVQIMFPLKDEKNAGYFFWDVDE